MITQEEQDLQYRLQYASETCGREMEIINSFYEINQFIFSFYASEEFYNIEDLEEGWAYEVYSYAVEKYGFEWGQPLPLCTDEIFLCARPFEKNKKQKAKYYRHLKKQMKKQTKKD